MLEVNDKKHLMKQFTIPKIHAQPKWTDQTPRHWATLSQGLWLNQIIQPYHNAYD